MNTLTKQEIFETVSKHLFTQGKRSFGTLSDKVASEGCLYRGPDSTSCAVGCLIPDDVYVSGMEGNALVNLISTYGDVLPSHIIENKFLLNDLQYLHDSWGNWGTSEGMRTNLKSVAQTHKLDSNFLDNLSFKDR